MPIQYVIHYSNESVSSPVASSSLPIGLVLVGDDFYGRHNNLDIDKIVIVHSQDATGNFTITGTATMGSPTIRSVLFTAGGDPEPLTAACRWVENGGVLTLTFGALEPAYEGGWVAWEFGEFTAPPTKLKVVVKRQKDPL